MTSTLLTLGPEAGDLGPRHPSSGGGSSWRWEPRLCLGSAPCDPSASPLEAANARLWALQTEPAERRPDCGVRGALPQIQAITKVMKQVGASESNAAMITLPEGRKSKVPGRAGRLRPSEPVTLQTIPWVCFPLRTALCVFVLWKTCKG